MTPVPFEIIGLTPSPVIGIVGLGQIGLSLAKDLVFSDLEVFGFDLSTASRQFASKCGVTVVEDIADLLKVADVVFYAIPAGRMYDAVRELSSVTFDRRVIVADLCSTKLDVERVFTSAPIDRSKVSYVGLHPLAGSEKRSYHGATRELFAGRVMVAAVGAATDVEALIVLAHLLIVATKCRIVFANPAAHDRLINFTIQIPHVFAYIASSFAKEVKDQVALEMFTGNSLRDVIRVARSDPAMVASFLYSNREVLLASLKSATARIESMIAVLDSGNERQLVELLDDFAPSTSKIIYEPTMRRCQLDRESLRALIDNLMSSPYLVDGIEVNEDGKLELSLVHLGEAEG